MALGVPTVWKPWTWLPSEADRILLGEQCTEGAAKVECLVDGLW